MSSAIIRNGHWRRRDPLKGLSATMRAAVRAFAEDTLGERADGRGINLRAVHALADRGLVRRRAGPDGLSKAYGLTPEGAAVYAEMQRRDAARLRLIAERPARALTRS